MTDRISWDEIIIYHYIPTERTGVFWIPSNKIYVYSLVKKFDFFHKYILDHEKKHYANYNCSKHYVIRIILDIWNEWKGAWKNTFNEDLIKDKEKYMEELFSTKKNKTIIKNMYVLMEELHETKATEKTLRYSKIVWCFRPYQPCGNLLVIILGVLLFLITKGIALWILT